MYHRNQNVMLEDDKGMEDEPDETGDDMKIFINMTKIRLPLRGLFMDLRWLSSTHIQDANLQDTFVLHV